MRLFVLVLAPLVVQFSLAASSRASAEGTVGTGPPGVTVTITKLTRLLGGAPPGAPRPVPCIYSLREVIDTMVPPGPYQGPSPGPDHRLYLLSCGPEYLRPVWLLPAAVAAVDPLDLLEQAIRELPFAPATIQAHPARALTGLGTTFTVTGYGALPVRAVVAELGTQVEVEATASRAQWAFGDGTSDPWATATSGGATAHTYERASARGATFPVTVQFEWAVRYRVDDGPWIAAPPITRRAALNQPVTEARSRLVPSPSS